MTIAIAVAIVQDSLSAPAAGVLIALVGALWPNSPLAALRQRNDRQA